MTAHRSTPPARVAQRLLARLLVAALCAGATASASAAASEPGVPGETPVRVERVRPSREKLHTFRFLRENRDWIRAQIDQLREKTAGRSRTAEPIDPRFLDYQRMLDEVLAGRDSTAVAAERWRRQELFGSVTELGQLEARLDQMERLLAEQRTRLGILQDDFTGRQQTALTIVVSGDPEAAAVGAIAVTLEDGDTLSVPLSVEQRQALRRGGVLQIFHGLVEPRRQVVEIGIDGDGWRRGDSGFVTLEPPRDRLTFLRIDLTPAHSGIGPSSLVASTWTHDSTLPGSAAGSAR